jgi:hypothetical protein
MRTKKPGCERRPVGIRAHFKKNRRSRGLARRDPQQDAQARQGSRPGHRRAIDIPKGKQVDESAFKVLVRQAVALNSSGKSKSKKKAKS